jgi:hypothetical protein
MGRSRNMPSRKKIFEYWQDKLDNVYDDNSCFKCGFGGEEYDYAMVDRAHILSVFDGGTDDVENIHLLCSNCHKKSEPYSGRIYYDWLKAKSEFEFSMRIMLGWHLDENYVPKELSFKFKAIKEDYINRNSEEEYIKFINSLESYV